MAIKAKKYGKNPRLALVFIIFLLVASIIICRQIDLQANKVAKVIKDGEVVNVKLTELANNRIFKEIDEVALRGMILDREGEPLAVSSPVSEIVAEPNKMLTTFTQEFEHLIEKCREDYQSNAACSWILDEQMSLDVRTLRYRKERLQPLAEVLGMEVLEVLENIESRIARDSFYLKRQVSPDESEAVLALAISGIRKEDRFQRFYPDGELSAQIIGYTNIDHKGQEGIEFQYDDWLSGQAGKKVVLVNGAKRILRVVDEEIATVQGQDLQLSIDKRIQYLMRRELLNIMQNYQPLSVSAVMVDVKTGEILGMLSLPDGNPNHRAERVPELMRNRVIKDIFEPGSVIKPIAVAAALQLGVITPKTQFPSGEMRIGANVVKDTHSYGVLDTVGVIRKSSNVGMAVISQKVPREYYLNFLSHMGFGQLSGLNFPGETSGFLPVKRKLGEFSYATTFFGYGLSTTALQIAHAYATLANDGVKLPLTLIKRNVQQTGEQVIHPEVAKQVLAMMQAVVEKGGTGTLAAMESYTAAGKTGTSHKYIDKVYVKDRYRSLFAGIAPVQNPRIALVIVVDEPKGQYYGGVVAAPSFARIAESSLKLLGVLPDKIGVAQDVALEIDDSMFEDNDFAGVLGLEIK